MLDVGYAVKAGLIEHLKSALGATLTEADLHTTIKGAIIGPSSGLNRNGRAIAFRNPSGEDLNKLGWRYFHPLTLLERVNAQLRSAESEGSSQGRDTHLNGLRAASNGDPLLGLLETLMNRVSAITMIERDEIEPDAPISKYGLDSLVSVELRNWIRRETSVELLLPRIVGAANLRALATHILSLKEAKK